MDSTEKLNDNNHIGEKVSEDCHDLGTMYDVIAIAQDGTSLLGSSNFTTRYWDGILSVFDSPDCLGDQTKCRASMTFEGGLGCAKFISSSKVVVGLDSGGVSLIDVITDTGSGMTILASSLEHDNVVSSLSTSRDGMRCVTGSFDRSLKVWNTDYLVCSHTYRPAHAESVLSVSIHPEDQDVMVSCSEDGRVILWDLRMPKPALALRKSFVSRASCVSFLPGRNPLHLLIGTVSGHLLELDAASPESLPSLEMGAHKRAIQTIEPSRDNPFIVACCSEDQSVVVVSVDPTHPQIIHSDERHGDVARGLAWSNTDSKRLYSCGWDQQILIHDISSM